MKRKTLIELPGMPVLARPISAADLAKSNPALASRWAGFIESNKQAIAGAVVAKLSEGK